MRKIIVKMEIRNKKDFPITKRIPKGRIIEVADRKSLYQHAMVARDYIVTIPPKEKVTVYLEAMCSISSRSWPQRTPANLTPYTFSGLCKDQDDLWKQLGY